MQHSTRALAALFVTTMAFLTGCSGGGGGGSSGPTSAPDAPTGLIAFEDDGQLVLSWNEVAGADGYTLYWSATSSALPDAGTPIALVTSPYLHAGLTNDTSYYYVVRAHNALGSSPASNMTNAMPVALSGSRYYPGWSDATPTQTIVLNYDGTKTSAQNGQTLANSIAALFPGQMLSVGSGTYVLPAAFSIQLQGTLAFPIWITTAAGAAVTLGRSGTSAPVVTVGTTGLASATQYVCLRGFNITGGSFGIEVKKSSELWIDRCHVHHVGGAAIHATSERTDNVHLTRNEIHDTASYGEGIVFGDNNLDTHTHDSVIAMNHIHDLRGALDGDGIELRYGCYANWIAENRVHHTRNPAILFQGNGGLATNLIERNLCYDTLDNVMQAEGGNAVVRNNVLLGPAGNKVFDSSHNQATLSDLTVVHNTMFDDTGFCAGLFAWNGQPNLVFANNVVYSNPWGPTTYAIAYTSGFAGGTMVGNVIGGNAHNVPSGGYTQGIGISDFQHVTSWTYQLGSIDDLRPAPLGMIQGHANAGYVTAKDYFNVTRAVPYEAGAIEIP